MVGICILCNMPVSITKTDGKYKVSTPHGTKAKGTTLVKAKAQVNLFRGVEHGWRPTGKKKRKIRSDGGYMIA